MSSTDRAHVAGAAALAIALLAAGSCGGRRKVLDPAFRDGGLLRDAAPITQIALDRLAGLYDAPRDAPRLRGAVVARSAPGTLSFFGAPDSAMAVLRAGCIDGGARVVLEGVWRLPREASVGLLRAFVGPAEVSRALCSGDAEAIAAIDPAAATIDLTTGEDADEPTEAATARFLRPLRDAGDRFLVGAHRGACRTIDDCGVSENSVESIREAEAFGASLVEIDVRLTKDGVPILYHDDDFTPRLSTGTYCHGPVVDFGFAHVRALCRLKYGEQVPTLDEALGAALDDTTLRAAWLDVKTVDTLGAAIDASKRFGARAAAKGRRFTVLVGMGTQELVDAFVAMGPPNVPCLVELEAADVRAAGCAFWGPRWTRGPMASDVAALQAEGRGAIYWALDELEYIDTFLRAGHPNALLSDRPGLVRQRFEVLLDVPVPAEVLP